MKISEFEEKYWNYYLHLEEKFMHISSFVHFDSRNFNVFSYEFERIQCLSPAKKYKLYKSSINKSLHFAQRSLNSSPRG